MDFPKDFDDIARAKIVAAEILATREMYGAWLPAQSEPLIVGTYFHLGTGRFFKYFMSIFAAFANEACVLGRAGVWSVDRIDRETREFLRVMISEALAKYAARRDLHVPRMFDESGSIARDVMDHLETYPEWQRFQSDLLEVAKTHALTKSRPAPEIANENDGGFNLVRRAAERFGLVAKQPVQEQTMGAQIRKLRDECRWTIEELAEATNTDERTVRRHEADEVVPYPRTIRAYEVAFSNELNRKVVISKMP